MSAAKKPEMKSISARVEVHHADMLAQKAEANGWKISDQLRKIITDSLDGDPLQQVANSLAKLTEEVEDLRQEVEKERKNLFVVLTLILRNVKDDTTAKAIIDQLQEKGLIA